MLTELKVKNFAIINEVHIHFKPGFNVLSGETGSGKSVLLKSLALLMGEKSHADTIKAGEPEALIEGVFDLKNRPDITSQLKDLSFDNNAETLIVRRLVCRDGKNKLYINGSLATLHQLKDIVCPLVELAGAPLIEMTSQHENKNMLSRAYQLELLDHYLGSTKLRQKIAHSYKELELLKNELAVLEDTARTRAERLDFLCFQRDEIKLAELSPGDDEVLEKRSSLLKASEKLSQFINRAELALYSDEDSALVRMHRITQEATEFAHLDTQILKWSEKLMDAKALLEDAVYELRSLAKNTNLDASELEETLEKLSLLRKLQKKHGPTATAILERLLEIENEIEGLENSDTKIESLKASIDKITLELKLLAKELHSKRLKGAKTLTESVNKELTDLNMKGVHFGIKITELDELSSTGISDVEFTIQSGSKDEPRSLARFASGGELSRILLSLKRVVGDNDYPRTYLFDEVDAGVSGVTAEKVGKKLKSIAQNQQVISVTHLPQVAAFADAHFMISKENKKGAVIMNVLALDKNERVQELARLLSGEKITKASIENAKQLLR